MVVVRVSDHLSQSICLEMLYSEADNICIPLWKVHHRVGKLSTAETLLTEVQRKVYRNKYLYSGKDFMITL